MEYDNLAYDKSLSWACLLVLDPIEKDGGRKFLRVVLFSSKDILKEMFESAKLGDVPDDVLVGRLALNIELPFSLDDFLIDPERTLTPRELAVRLAVHVDISRYVAAWLSSDHLEHAAVMWLHCLMVARSGFDERITDLLKAVPDDWAPYHWRLRAAMITFAREVDFQMHFSDVQSFIDHISAEGLGPGTSFREQVEALCESCVECAHRLVYLSALCLSLTPKAPLLLAVLSRMHLKICAVRRASNASCTTRLDALSRACTVCGCRCVIWLSM